MRSHTYECKLDECEAVPNGRQVAPLGAPDRKTQKTHKDTTKPDFTPLRRLARMLYPITSAAYPYPTLAPENFAAMAVPLGRPAMPRVSTMCERARK
ncbi:MAG TPA: hypothetical protein VH934_18535, partial [Xanthobacteraceae bacterium]